MTHLSQAEVAQWASIFNDIDRDGDGHVCIAECVEMLRVKHRAKTEWLSKQDAKKFEHILAHAPVGAEQKFDFSTFKNWIHHHGKHANESDPEADTSGSESAVTDSSTSSSDEEGETMHQLFNAIDSDRNGYITLEEMIDMEREQAEENGHVFDEHARREELMHFMRLGDLDRDHRLSLQEFMMAMRKRAQDGSAFYSDSETDQEQPAAKRRMQRKKSVRAKFERRKSKRVVGLMKLAGVNKKELKLYTKTKDERIDLSDYDVCARLRQVFDTLDNDGDDRIDVDEFLALEQNLMNVEDRSQIDVADRRNTLRKLHKQYADDEQLLPFQQFMNALYDLRLTNDHLKKTWDAVLWAKEKTKVDVTDMDLQDIQTGLTTLRASVLKTDDDDDAAASMPMPKSPRASDGELKKTRDQLMLALRLADTLQDKLSRSQAEVGLLTSELLKYKRGNDLPPPPDVVVTANGDGTTSTTAPASAQRSHAERNQEFFYLSALAVKLNIEAKYKTERKAAPHMIPTRQLYEAAMAAKVPFQFYYKWVERQLDPTAHHHHHRHKSKAATTPSTD